MLGTGAAFDEALIAARPHPGQVAVGPPPARAAGRQRDLGHRTAPTPTTGSRTPYSLRCMPQVHGAARDALAELERVLRVEINAATDNPLVFPTGEVVSRRQLPRRAAGAGARLRHDGASPSWRRSPSAEPRAWSTPPLRPAGLPRRATRRRERADDRPLHRRGPGQRAADARPPVIGRHDPDQRQPGGPRQHGRHLRAPPARGGRSGRAGARHRGAVRGPGPRLPRAAATRRRRRGGARRHPRARCRTSTPTDRRRPTSPTVRELVHAGDLLANGATAATPMAELEFTLARRGERSTTSRRRRSPARDARPATTGSASTAAARPASRRAPTRRARDAEARSACWPARELSGSYAHARLPDRCGRADRRRLRPVRAAERLPPRAGHPRPLPASCPSRPRRGSSPASRSSPADGRGARPRSASSCCAAVCDELDRRGITAVEAYPEGVADPWLPSPGPASVYEAADFERAAGDERYPVYRRELTGETDADAWSDLLRASAPATTTRTAGRCRCRRSAIPTTCSACPRRSPKRPNPFGDD